MHNLDWKPTGNLWEPLYEHTFFMPWQYVFIGGLFYARPDRHLDFADLARLSLMPDYCHTRLEPIQQDGRSYFCALYVKMPLICVARKGHAEGLVFPTHLKVEGQVIPLWLNLEVRDQEVTFRLGLLRRFTVLRKPRTAYRAWVPSRLEPQTVEISLHDAPIPLALQHVTARTWEELVTACTEDLWLRDPDPDDTLWRRMAQKALQWLDWVWDEQSGFFLEWKWRDQKGFKGGLEINLFSYNTLASDLFWISKERSDSLLAYRALKTRDLLLHPEASLLTDQGRVWHNTASYDPVRKRHVFYTHLGTGIGGYPGGQATVLRNLLERALLGDKDEHAIRAAAEGLDWLINQMLPNGAWSRILYIFPEASPYKLEPDECGPSIGSNAEGALALLLGHKLFDAPKYLEAGLRALQWLNEAAGSFPVTSGYLRDNRIREPDGVSALWALLANLMAHELTGEPDYLACAHRFACYGLTWIRWWHLPSFDPLAVSFTPRLAHCESAWAAHAFSQLHKMTGQDIWYLVAEKSMSTLETDSDYPGFSEATYLDEQLQLHPLAFECVYTASAVLRACMDRLTWSSLEWPRNHTSCARQAYPGQFVYVKRFLTHRFPWLRALGRFIR